MSYIHDALKASSEQRKAVQGEPGPAAAAPLPEETAPKSRWSLGRVLLILLLGLLLYWFWRSPGQQETPLEPVDNGEPEVVTPNTSAVEPDEPDLSGVKIAIRNEPPAQQTPARPVAAETPVAEQPVRVEQPVAVEPEPEVEPRQQVSSGPYANLPYLRQLPVEQQRELKGIRFTVHIYSDEPRSRMVKYEDRVLREGYYVRPGLRIEAIIPRGVVLQYRETRFKVPAL